MAGEAIGGCGGGAEYSLEGQGRLVRGFARRTSGARSESGRVGRSDFERGARANELASRRRGRHGLGGRVKFSVP